jgi:hypothetical protein
VYDYRDLIAVDELRVKPAYPVFPTVMPAWDNTARRGARGHVFHNATPQTYEVWLRNAIARAAREPVAGEQIVFVNAWNEWAEGTHLEPDRKWGHAFLEATRRAMADSTSWRAAAANLMDRYRGSNADAVKLVESLTRQIESLEAANAFLRRHIDPTIFRKQLEAYALRPDLPADMLADSLVHPAMINVEQANHASAGPTVRLRRDGEVYVKGWSFTPGLAPPPDGREAYVALLEIESGRSYGCLLGEREFRADVSRAFPQFPEQLTGDSGFSCMLDLRGLPMGHYKLAILERGQNRVGVAFGNSTFEIR